MCIDDMIVLTEEIRNDLSNFETTELQMKIIQDRCRINLLNLKLDLEKYRELNNGR